MLSFIPYAILGFATYELLIRFIDQTESSPKKIGWGKYIVYLGIFGSFSSILSASFASSFFSDSNFGIFLSLIGGFAVPSSGRIALLSIAKAYMKLVNNSLVGRQKPPGPTAANVEDQSPVEEAWTYESEQLNERYSVLEMLLGHRLR